ncbi:hypothetical protein GCM10026987_23950 [Belliella aquatica]|uniref:Transposase zinc-ribbon domain-containing protein n=1 Tax=Belliella aquatica TaxID=1323734 RepID=A0ABQ1N613_9BACT|nr:hypothetical protein GCM10010993_37000 [Belliella aquatica]
MIKTKGYDHEFLKFNDRFPDEKSCTEYFKSKRIKEGDICKKCKGIDHYWLHSKTSFNANGVVSEPVLKVVQ